MLTNVVAANDEFPSLNNTVAECLSSRQGDNRRTCLHWSTVTPTVKGGVCISWLPEMLRYEHNVLNTTSVAFHEK